MKIKNMVISISRFGNKYKNRLETLFVLVFLFGLVFSNIILTLDLHPVWLDEVTVADPAVNLYKGNGFTSTGWQYQAKDEFWASNAPFHQILLYHWMLIFGFNPVSVRSINFILMAGIIFLLWISSKKLNIIKDSFSRIALIFLLAYGAGMSLNYASGRYDCIGILLLSGLLFSFTLKEPFRCLLVLILSFLIPIAGINLIPYAFIGYFLVFLTYRKDSIKYISISLLGIFLGVLSLYTLYALNGVPKAILASAGGHGLSSAIDTSDVSSMGETNIAEKASFVLHNLPMIILNRIKRIPSWYLQNPSYVLLVLFSSIVVIFKARKKEWTFKSVSGIALLLSYISPLAFGFLRDYPFYYTWMAYIPITITSTSLVFELRSRNDKWKWAFLVLVLLIMTQGHLKTIAANFISPTNYKQEYLRVDPFVRKNIPEDSIVYSHFEAYYSIKNVAHTVYLRTYDDLLTNTDKRDIEYLLIREVKKDDVLPLIGGDWQQIDSLNGKAPYDLIILNRATKE